MAKLVAFYSRADENYFGNSNRVGSTLRYVEVGNTEIVAKMIAEITGAELFKIEQKVPYSSMYEICMEQAKKDKNNKARPELVRLPDDISRYDEIYLGYPNYWGTMPMAVYTFLEAFDWTGKTIHPFCTHEDSGLSSTERDIANTAKGATVGKGLAIKGGEVNSARETVENWCK